MRIMAWVTGRPHRVIKAGAEPDDDAYPELKHALQLGRCSRELRERQGMSQLQLARAAGMQVDSLERFESGAYLPSLPVLERVAKALGVSLDIRLR
jgi:ribosome-binding protein aMBF1 (putative translation factor)